ncbi:MAG: ABC transporter substrate-binding protein, partial [Synergistaceae bacterium]|nr:ABC transporter substrate-binding protein [Synergistaceae bacterium]
MKKLRLLVFIIAVFAAFRLDAAEMTDDAGTRHSFDSPPARVVSLLPSVTEVICYIGASDALAGITYHDTNFEGTAGKTVVGGAFTPQYEIINELKPDLLITSPRDFERTKAGRAENSYPILVIDDGVSLAESEKRILMLGEIFGRQDEAKRVIEGNRAFMETIRLKVDKIPNERRKKVILLYMGADGPLTPGRGSFQRELIEAAGGITGDFGDGPAVPITLEQWREFAPDYVFTVPSDHAELKEFLNGDGWRDVPAVRDGRVSSFPDALVCRASAHTGYFVAWLSSDIYADEFADAANLVHPQEVIGEREISVDIPYVESVRIVESRIMDFVHRTLLVDFKRPQHIVSTNYGERGGVETVGNSYSPTPTWSIYHKLGFERSQEDLL